MIHDRIIPSLPKCFVDVPDFPFEIRPVVGRVSGPMGFYYGATPDKTSPGVFFIGLEKYSTSPKCLWLSLILHEAIPGHHLQDIYGLATEVRSFVVTEQSIAALRYFYFFNWLYSSLYEALTVCKKFFFFF